MPKIAGIALTFAALTLLSSPAAGAVQIVLNDEAAWISAWQQAAGDSPPAGVEAIRPARDARLETFAMALHERRRHKGLDQDHARALISKPLHFAAALVASGDCDGGERAA